MGPLSPKKVPAGLLATAGHPSLSIPLSEVRVFGAHAAAAQTLEWSGREPCQRGGGPSALSLPSTGTQLRGEALSFPTWCFYHPLEQFSKHLYFPHVSQTSLKVTSPGDLK